VRPDVRVAGSCALVLLLAAPVAIAVAQEAHDHLVTQCVDIPPGQDRP
jgi:hypothetical protein